MKHLSIKTLSLLSAILLVSCSGNSKTTVAAQETSVNGTLANPETADKNSPEYQPAFEGQTRVQGVKTSTAYNVEVINSDLHKPWGIINLPDGRFLITSKTGHLNIVSADGKTISKVEGLPKVDAKGQGGLLDVALDPDFQNNKMIYWTFSEPVSGGNHTAVAKGKLSADEKRIENPSVIFRATPTYDGDKHYGSRLEFDKDGHLFVSTGERSDLETRPYAQKQDSYLGKILKITKDGKPAPGNPQIAGWKPEIYSTGHRNPQGMAIDVKGQIWDAEMGPRGGDEINLIQPGKNYGWGDVTYGIEYSGKKINNGTTQKAGTEQPVYYWDPSISMSGITFYTGNIEEWKNNMMIGCLSGEKIIRLVIENNKVVGEEWLLTDKNDRIRDVLNGQDGNLYAVSDSGKLYRISKK
ncbi:MULTISPECIES: PQQ-dependent sugar dehydrogenase [Chryseobacterium group]|uniref:PQQ-dependent sugar dehydrogenase n=1 Tax=Chryseobacterium group TaxID=2782232 RepID=UPI001C4444F1|nr:MULTISPECIES: PQQ-dependent sugar dehydrogenase [Chryseobacterium]MCP2037160.1 glucose/arabinose dehydrogenase [Chryseobacterium sp. HSC-36S06]UFK96618.1 PQQ-dependent sugar dehydrogenase [Chryseobacterium faecale]